MPWLVQDTSSEDLGRTRHSSGYDALEYEFHLEVEGKLTGIFQALKGGDIEVAKIEHDIVFENGLSTTLFIPGATSFGELSLERGYANYHELYDWLMEASNGRIIQARRSGTIWMTRHGEMMLQWNFANQARWLQLQPVRGQEEGPHIDHHRSGIDRVRETPVLYSGKSDRCRPGRILRGLVPVMEQSRRDQSRRIHL